MLFCIFASDTLSQDKSEEWTRLGFLIHFIENGRPNQTAGAVKLLFIGQVELAGSMDPFTMRPGTELLPALLVYNGNRIGIQAALAHHHSTSGLSNNLALFLSPDSGLQVEDQQIRIVGTGGVVFFGPPDHPLLAGSDISQYSPGDTLQRSLIPGL